MKHFSLTAGVSVPQQQLQVLSGNNFEGIAYPAEMQMTKKMSNMNHHF